MPVPQTVAAAYGDIQAILARNDLSGAEKRSQVVARKAQATDDQFTFNFNSSKSVTLPDDTGAHWTVSADSVSYDPTKGLVELFGVHVLKNGVDVEMDPHLQFVNPPILFPDSGGAVTLPGQGKFRVDPAAVILNQIIQMGQRLAP